MSVRKDATGNKTHTMEFLQVKNSLKGIISLPFLNRKYKKMRSWFRPLVIEGQLQTVELIQRLDGHAYY